MSAVRTIATFFTWAEMKTAERRLEALERGIRFVAQHAGESPGFCANAYWCGAVKPHLVEIVGDGRGFEPEDASLPDGDGHVLTVVDLLAPLPPRRPAGTAIETFLRTPEAYDTASHNLYELLPGCRRCACL